MKYGTINEAIDIIYDKVTTDDWDEVIAIVGKNRRGKSNLGLQIVDRWLTKLNGEVLPEDAKNRIGIDTQGFSKVIKNAKKFCPVVHDEAGDLSNRRSMSKTNTVYAQAYQIIAGENLLTILILPELWDLDSYFRKHRIRHLIEVYQRGRFKFWTNKRYVKMVERNATFTVKNYNIVGASFIGTFPKYDGVLKAGYDELKSEKLASVRDFLDSEMNGGVAADNLRDAKAMKKIKDKYGLSNTEIGEFFGCHHTTVGTRMKLVEVLE